MAVLATDMFRHRSRILRINSWSLGRPSKIGSEARKAILDKKAAGVSAHWRVNMAFPERRLSQC